MIRPLETSDWRAARALCTRPDVAWRCGATPFDPLPAWERRFAEVTTPRLGVFREGELAAFAILRVPRNPRLQHAAELDVASIDADAARQALSAAVDTADRWMGLVRVEVEAHAADPFLAEVARELGFEREVRRKADRQGDGADTLVLGRLRPGFSQRADALAPSPTWPPSGPRAEATLRTAGADDAGAYAAILRDPSVLWGTLQLPTASAAQWVPRLASNDQIGRHGLVAEVEGEVVGTFGLHRKAYPHEHTGHVGMGIHAAWQGRGVGRRLLDAGLDLADRWLGLSRVELEVYVDNDRARALYERTGFVAEGVRRAASFRDGGYADTLVMGRLRATPPPPG